VGGTEGRSKGREGRVSPSLREKENLRGEEITKNRQRYSRSVKPLSNLWGKAGSLANWSKSEDRKNHQEKKENLSRKEGFVKAFKLLTKGKPPGGSTRRGRSKKTQKGPGPTQKTPKKKIGEQGRIRKRKTSQT